MTGDLSRVRARLEIAVTLIPNQAATPEEEYSRFEETAAAILDSEFQDFQPGILETYLISLCKVKQLELGIDPNTND